MTNITEDTHKSNLLNFIRKAEWEEYIEYCNQFLILYPEELNLLQSDMNTLRNKAISSGQHLTTQDANILLQMHDTTVSLLTAWYELPLEYKEQ